MNKIEELKQVFEENSQKIEQVVKTGSEVLEIVIGNLTSLQRQFAAGSNIYQKLNNTITIFKNIDKNGSLKERFQIIYNQGVVLLVGNLQSFLNDVFRGIVNDYSYLLKFTEGKESKIGIDLSLLQYTNTTIGDLVVNAYKDKYNFQDLQSTVKFFKELLGLELELVLTKEIKDNIILFEALRHVIVHNSSRIDAKFLSQVRNTSYAKKYSQNEAVILTLQDFGKAKDTMSKFTSLILEMISKNIVV